VTLAHQIDALERRLARALDGRVSGYRLRIERLARDLGDPRHRTSEAKRQHHELQAALVSAMRAQIAVARKTLRDREAIVTRHDPRARLAGSRRRHAELETRLVGALDPAIARGRRDVGRLVDGLGHAAEVGRGRRRAALGRAVARLEALSPLAVLSRGYAIALHGETGAALTNATDAGVGDVLDIVLHEGRLSARVETVKPRESPEETEE